VRLPFPTHIPISKAFLFAVGLFFVQQLEHTELLFSVLAFVFVVVGTLGFNLAGGFSRPSGAYIFWFVTLAGLVGLIWKAVLREPAQTNLEMPDVTMAAYDASVLAMLAAVLLTRRMVRNSKGIGGLLHSESMDLGQASLGCMAFAVLLIPIGAILPTGGGSLVSIIYRLNISFPLGIILSILHTIRRTQGRHSLNLLSFAAMVFLFVYGGLATYSKQGLFSPMVCWLIPACAARYQLKLRHIVVLASFGILAFTVLTPLSEVGRGSVPENYNTNQRIAYSVSLMSHPFKLHSEYMNSPKIDRSDPLSMRGGYFDTNQGLFDRLTMMPIDSGLIAYSERGHYLGFEPVLDNMENWVPHFILPNKATPVTGNFYAHEIGGLLAANDVSTGISFSPASELFHWEGWFGLLVLGPLIWGLLFFVSDFVSGDLRVYPWGLLLVLIFGHVAPELGIGGAINFVWLGNASVIAAALFSTQIAPILGSLFGGHPNPEPQGSLTPVFPPA
jgi:hypothetical protein